MMEIAFSHITAKKFNINFFLTLVTGCRNHACCMADQIASKRQRRNQSCFGSVYFFVCLLNSFERVPVPTVTQKPYGSNESNVGMPMLRSELSLVRRHYHAGPRRSDSCWLHAALYGGCMDRVDLIWVKS